MRKYHPIGRRLLLSTKPIEEKTAGGLIVVKETRDQDRLAVHEGIVEEIGHNCWSDVGDGRPWCKVGDKVMFQRYAGLFIWDADEGKFRDDFIFLNDLDVIATIEEREDA